MRKVDITSKLNFEDNSSLVIKGEVYPINDDATTVLKVIELTQDGTLSGITSAYDILFDKATKKRIDALKLKGKDFMILIKEAISVALGGDDEEDTQ